MRPCRSDSDTPGAEFLPNLETDRFHAAWTRLLSPGERCLRGHPAAARRAGPGGVGTPLVGVRWRPDENDVAVSQRYALVVREMSAEAHTILQSASDDPDDPNNRIGRALRTWANKSEANGRRVCLVGRDL